MCDLFIGPIIHLLNLYLLSIVKYTKFVMLAISTTFSDFCRFFSNIENHPWALPRVNHNSTNDLNFGISVKKTDLVSQGNFKPESAALTRFALNTNFTLHEFDNVTRYI